MSHGTVVKKIQEFGGSVPQAARNLGVPVRTLYRWYQRPQNVNKNVNRFVVTYAQNATQVHKGFYGALMNYLHHWRAELICFKGLYRNPKTQEDAADHRHVRDLWWTSEIQPFLLDTERTLNENLVIYPARTQPTSVAPLSGYDSHTGDKSGIFPHPKIHLKTVPTPGSKMPKILTTTGAITEKNYSRSKAGEKGQYHHKIGAVVVEVVNNEIFHLRHIEAEDNGTFYDIAGGKCWKYSPDGIEKRQSIEVLTKGDIHYPWVDESVINASKELISQLKPDKVYLHDLIDFWARNHHVRNDRFLNYAKNLDDMQSVRDEMRGAAKFLTSLSSDKYELGIVVSNHDEALDRWLNEEKVDKLGINASYFHWLSHKKHESAVKTGNGFSFMNMLEFAISEFITPSDHNIRFLKRDVAEVIRGIDYGMHGDVGPNGSRGSSTNLSKIGVKTTIGHAHSPSILNDCYQVGVNCIIPLGYTRGPLGWLHTDCITYRNGKRTLINYINGKWYLKNDGKGK